MKSYNLSFGTRKQIENALYEDDGITEEEYNFVNRLTDEQFDDMMEQWVFHDLTLAVFSIVKVYVKDSEEK